MGNSIRCGCFAYLTIGGIEQHVQVGWVDVCCPGGRCRPLDSVGIVEKDAHISDTPDTGVGTECRKAGFNPWVAEDAFFRPPGFPVEIDFFIWTAGNAVPPDATTLLIYQYDTVFVSFVKGAGRARRHTGRIETVFAQSRQVEHKDIAKLQIKRHIQTLKVDVTPACLAQTGQIIFPIRSPLEFDVITGQLRARSNGRLMPAFGAADKLVVIVTPELIVIVDGRQVRIMKNVEPLVQFAARLEFKLSVFKMPATVVDILVLPFLGVSNPRFALIVI